MGRSLTAILPVSLFSISLLFVSLTASADLRHDLFEQVKSTHRPISYDQALVALLGNVGLIRLKV